MIGSEGLHRAKDKESVDNIRKTTAKSSTYEGRFSFSIGSYTDDSDYNLYLVIDSGRNVT